jgi:hypothetical protein
MNRMAKAAYVGLCAVALLFCTAQMGVAQRSLTKKQARLFLRNLPAVDKVEVMQFGSDPAVRDNEVVARKFIEGVGAGQLAALWRVQSYGPDRSACHNPGYAVRFFIKGKELVYASVCWSCSNILFFGPDFLGGLHFEGENRNGQRLEQFFQKEFSGAEQAKSAGSFSSKTSNGKQ